MKVIEIKWSIGTYRTRNQEKANKLIYTKLVNIQYCSKIYIVLATIKLSNQVKENANKDGIFKEEIVYMD